VFLQFYLFDTIHNWVYPLLVALRILDRALTLRWKWSALLSFMLALKSLQGEATLESSGSLTLSGWITDLECLLGWGRLPLYGRYGCVEMTKFLMIRIVLSCRLSTDVPLLSVRGLRCKRWRIATSLRRSVHGWRTRRGILFSYMDDSIIYGLGPHLHLRRLTVANV
jgi:hypothetical protein